LACIGEKRRRDGRILFVGRVKRGGVLRDYLAGFHIESLCTVPATYRPVDADELVIREFEVRKVQF
jgi:hypothetical protein